MKNQAKVTIGQVTHQVLRACFWENVRKSETLGRLVTQVKNGKTADQLFVSALRDTIAISAQFLCERKLLDTRYITVINGVAQFLLADQAMILGKLQDMTTLLLPHAEQYANVQGNLQKIAHCTSNDLNPVAKALHYDKSHPHDPDLLKKILATHDRYHPGELQVLEKRILANKACDDFEKFVLKNVFSLLKTEAREQEYAQTSGKNSAEWKLGVGLLNELVAKEPDFLKPLGEYSPAVKSATQVASVMANEAVMVADALEFGVFGEPKPQHVPMELVFNPAGDLAGQELAAELEKFTPLGEKRNEAFITSTWAGTVLGATVHSHGHLESSALHLNLEQASDAALAAVLAQSSEVQHMQGYCLASAFLEQRAQMNLQLPAIPAPAPGYYALAREAGKMTWNYGWSMLGYPQSAAQAELEDPQLEALYRASGSRLDMMQQASHFLSDGFAKDCFLGPLESLSVDGSDCLLRLDAGPAAMLARMDPGGPRYAYSVELLDTGKTAVTVEASWQILAYGRGQATHVPQDTLSSAVRSSVQVILSRTEDEAGNVMIEPDVVPLGISASIDNVIDIRARKAA